MLAQVIATVKLVAHEEIMPRYLRVERIYKKDGSFYTEADTAAQNRLAEKLHAIYPAAIVGEEMTDAEQLEQWTNGQAGLWCIDPIDGTSNFMNGLPYFAVSVALMQDGRSVLGVIYNPATDECFYAEQGKGAFLNGQALPLSRRKVSLHRAIANVDLKRLQRQLAGAIVAAPPYASQRNYGACTLEWCYTAAGYFDLYLHGGQKPWDYAAGCLIMEEADGHRCTLENDDYWSEAPWRRSVIAALDETLFVQWRDWVRSHAI
ncbi:MAG: inositol monophosphatase family protein [Nitrosomonas sp.]|nr:inositol monophosphatase family protein [Nitrosomonas sp.]